MSYPKKSANIGRIRSSSQLIMAEYTSATITRNINCRKSLRRVKKFISKSTPTLQDVIVKTPGLPRKNRKDFKKVSSIKLTFKIEY